MKVRYGRFIWDDAKEAANIAKHGVGFTVASEAFLDPGRKVFTDREGHIRIFGAGYWRRGKQYYEKT